jgi:hypothetical protein
MWEYGKGLRERMMDVMAVAAKTESLLRALGNTGAEVAASLRRAGVRGERVTPDQCPLARWLAEKLGGDKEVKVGAAYASVQGGGLPEVGVMVRLPYGALEFREQHDALVYPDLVA